MSTPLTGHRLGGATSCFSLLSRYHTTLPKTAVVRWCATWTQNPVNIWPLISIKPTILDLCASRDDTKDHGRARFVLQLTSNDMTETPIDDLNVLEEKPLVTPAALKSLFSPQ